MNNITPFPIERIRKEDFQECLDRLHQAWVNIPNVMSKKEFDWYKEYCSRCDLPEEVENKYWFIDNDRDIMQTDYYEQDPSEIDTLAYHLRIVLGLEEYTE